MVYEHQMIPRFTNCQWWEEAKGGCIWLIVDQHICDDIFLDPSHFQMNNFAEAHFFLENKGKRVELTELLIPYHAKPEISKKMAKNTT